MNLYDAQRPRVGATPALLPRKDFVVPRICVWPLETSEKVRISVMVPMASDTYAAREVSNTIETSRLPELLAEFRADPEEFISSFFEVNLTESKVAPSSKIFLSSDDYDL